MAENFKKSNPMLIAKNTKDLGLFSLPSSEIITTRKHINSGPVELKKNISDFSEMTIVTGESPEFTTNDGDDEDEFGETKYA